MHRFNFKSAIFAGFIATVVMTVWMFVFKMDLMKTLGVAAGMKGNMVYIVGGIIHLCVGLFWGIIYAWLFEPWMKGLPGFLSGAFFSLVPFVIALFFIGSFFNLVRMAFGNEQKDMSMGMIGSFYEQQVAGGCATCPKAQPKESAKNKKNAPKVRGQKTSGSSCYPCYMDDGCGPCAPDDMCAPCAPDANMSPDQNQQGTQGYGAGPMPNLKSKTYCPGKKGGMFGLALWLWSLINHLVYGITLGIVYRPHKQAAK